MRVWWINGACAVIFPGLAQTGVPSLRLVQHLSPRIRVEVEADGPKLVFLDELDLTYETLRHLNTSGAPVSGVHLVDPEVIAKIAALAR